MRQVPDNSATYLLIGNGKLAHCLKHYLSQKKIQHKQWFRNSTLNLQALAKESSHILFAISDSEIESFYKKHQTNFQGKTLVHFSGAMEVQNIHSAHPAYSFSKRDLSIEEFESIPFGLFDKKFQLSDILPHFVNPSRYIPAEKKALYHALCVCSANFPQMIWKEVKCESKSLDLSIDFFFPLVKSSFENISHSDHALTGPIIRNDETSIQRNLNALSQSLKDIYLYFLNYYTHKKGSNSNEH